MKKNFALIIACVFGLATASVGAAYAIGLIGENPRTPVDFYNGHTHDDVGTHGAPKHSGGTDSYGCHNGSVPYHCH